MFLLPLTDTAQDNLGKDFPFLVKHFRADIPFHFQMSINDGY